MIALQSPGRSGFYDRSILSMAQTKQTMPLDTTSSSAKSPRSPSALPSLLLTVSVLWCVYWFFHAWHYWEDDAYIHLEFARSVAACQGFAFNGHVVAGDTAPLWVLLLAAVHLLIPNWLVAGKVLTILGAIFGFSGIYAFARRIGDRFTSSDRGSSLSRGDRVADARQSLHLLLDLLRNGADRRGRSGLLGHIAGHG